MLNTVWQDIRYGFRILRRSPLITVLAILTLALGIGANAAIFSIVNGVLLRPLPFPEPNRIVYVEWLYGHNLMDGFTIQEFTFWRDNSTVFSDFAGYRGSMDLELKSAASASWIKTFYVTDGFFPSFGIHPALGRDFDRADTHPDSPGVVILTDSLWRSAFAADPQIIGRQINLSDRSYTVAGVLPPGFTFAQPADAYVALKLGHSIDDEGNNTGVVARLKPGVTIAQAHAEMPLIAARFRKQAPGFPAPMGAYAMPYQQWLAGDFRTSLLLLLAAVGLLLLIACANVASLLLARAASRQKEIAVRLALGAGRSRLLRQFFTESLLLGAAGCIAGLLMAYWSLHAFISVIPWDLPATSHVEIDPMVLAFAALIGVGVSIVFGLASYFQSGKINLNDSLKSTRASSGGSGGRLLNVLVAGEIAVSLMLALGAGLLIQSLYRLHQQRLGFNPANLYTMETPFTPSEASSPAAAWSFEQQALARINAIPGVKSAAVVSVVPLGGQFNLPTQRDGHPEDSIGGMEYRAVSPDYFSTMQIPLLRGRLLLSSDDASAPHVALIDETLARAWWPNGNPIGDHIVIGEFRGKTFPQIAEAPREIVGIVGDVKGMVLDEPPPPMIYLPASQANVLNGSTAWVVRSAPYSGLGNELRSAILSVVSDQQVKNLQPISQLLSGSLAGSNFDAILMGLFAGLALLLTLVGVYGILTFQVAQRTQEIGIRLALGSQPREIARLIVRQAAKITLIGVAIGLAAAFALSRLMSALLFEVKAGDPLTFAAVALLLIFVALLAAYIPARRAARVDPIVALRYE